MPNIDFDLVLLQFGIILIGLIIWDVISLVRFIVRLSTKKKEQQPDQPHQRLALKISRFILQHKLILLHIVLLPLSGGMFYSAISTPPQIMYQSSYPEHEGVWENYFKPIEVVFNVPVDAGSLKPFLSREELIGKWEYSPYLGNSSITRVAKFYPDSSLMPKQRVVLYIVGVKRPWVDEYHEHALNFFSHTPAEIFSTIPINGMIEVNTESQIQFTFTKDISPSEQWTFTTEPEFEFTTETTGNRTVTLTPTKPLAQSQHYVINVYRAAATFNLASGEIEQIENPEMVHRLQFNTIKAPLVKRFSPSGTGVMPETEIEIMFEVAMDKQSVETNLQISPPTDYAVSWFGDRTLSIIPTSALPKETEYIISFPPGLMSKSGGLSDREIRYSFTTIGAVRVSSFSPANGTTRTARNSHIQVVFDQEVDHTSAQTSFTISPPLPGNFVWEGNTLYFQPTQLMSFDTTYSVTIQAGVKTVHGLDSKEVFTSSFSTVSNTTIISGFGPGLYDRQDYNFSCTVAATKMALQWKNIYLSEYDIIYNRIGADQSSMDCTSGTCYWGNPNSQYLGYPNGSGTYGTGQSAYGVHWQPIINLFSQLGITTELKRNWNIYGLAETINAGHPVQIWWWNGISSLYGNPGLGGSRIDWIDRSTGQQVEAIHGMHSILVVGFNGDVANPTSFIVLDPWWGYNTYSIAKFNNQWPKLQNTAVIIY